MVKQDSPASRQSNLHSERRNLLQTHQDIEPTLKVDAVAYSCSSVTLLLIKENINENSIKTFPPEEQ